MKLKNNDVVNRIEFISPFFFLQFLDVITCSGGKYLKTSLPARKNDAVICISNEQDSKLVAQLKKNYGSMKEITAEEFMQAIFHYKI